MQRLTQCIRPWCQKDQFYPSKGWADWFRAA